MAQEDKQTNLRFPPELKEKLQQMAASARRSLTAEVMFRLEQSFAQTEQQRREAHALTAQMKTPRKLQQPRRLVKRTQRQIKELSCRILQH